MMVDYSTSEEKKQDKLDVIKIKNFCSTNYTIKKADNPQNGRKCLQVMYLIRDLYLEHVKNMYNSIINEWITIWKWAKDLNRYFCKLCVRVSKEHIKWCLRTLFIRKMQIKSTMKCHFTPTGMTKSKKIVSVGEDVEKLEPSYMLVGM